MERPRILPTGRSGYRPDFSGQSVRAQEGAPFTVRPQGNTQDRDRQAQFRRDERFGRTPTMQADDYVVLAQRRTPL